MSAPYTEEELFAAASALVCDEQATVEFHFIGLSPKEVARRALTAVAPLIAARAEKVGWERGREAGASRVDEEQAVCIENAALARRQGDSIETSLWSTHAEKLGAAGRAIRSMEYKP